MQKIGGKPGATITTYDNKSNKKVIFSFFHFLNGQIQMTITKGNKEKIVVFKSEEDFVNRAELSGLPSQFIQTVILASQI